MSRNCQPIVFRDSDGLLWAYYMKRHCLTCRYPTAHLIEPSATFIKCGECLHITSVESDCWLTCESCNHSAPWLIACNSEWVRIELEMTSAWVCMYCIEEEAA